jgi:uncharacterized protein (TIGR03435 family)
MNGGPGTSDPTLFTCRNCSLAMLLMRAFDVKYYQLSGLGSRGESLVDISARVPEGSNLQQFRMMLRHFLEDRFGLLVHHETRKMQMYELHVAKGGPKFASSTGGGGLTVTDGWVRMASTDESMAEFAERLSNQLDAPVRDFTGLKGKYSFALTWGLRDDADFPRLFSAIQDQLGLKLSAKKGPVGVIVVDHVEKLPSGN